MAARRRRKSNTPPKSAPVKRSEPDASPRARAASAKTGLETGSKTGAKPGTTTDPKVARIQSVIDVMVAAGAVEVEMEGGGERLRIRLKEDRPSHVVSYGHPVGGMPPQMAQAHDVQAPSAPSVSSAPRADAAPAVPAARQGEVFKSPMVGTFYRASSPDSDPFVKLGQRVGAETTLCIIEAMKVMNEIKAEIEGEVVEILAQNGEPVEFGQPLFVIKV